MKKTIKVYLHMSTDAWSRGELAVYQCDLSDNPSMGVVLIKPLEIEVEIPDDFDPRPAQIKALEAKQKQAAADFHKLSTEIMRQIQEMQALEMTV